MSASVSVIMSVFNAEKYIKESISSILTQSFSDFEFIIIDDGSTDNSVEIIDSFHDTRIFLVRQNHTGLSKALNKGIALSNTDFIVRMDADDISLPDRIKLQYEFLTKNPRCVAVGSNAIEIDINGKYIFTSNLLLNWKDINEFMIERLNNKTPWNPFYHSSITFRKDYFYKAGGYDEIFIKSQDIILFNKMSKIGELWNLKTPLIKYRIVPTATTNRKLKKIKFFRSILVKALDNRKITNDEINYLNEISSNTNIRNRKIGYHLYLGKNYLFRNNKPRLSRNNLTKVLQLNPLYFLSYLLLILTFFPKGILIKMYNYLNNYLNIKHVQRMDVTIK